jgi:hypothetical protein
LVFDGCCRAFFGFGREAWDLRKLWVSARGERGSRWSKGPSVQRSKDSAPSGAAVNKATAFGLSIWDPAAFSRCCSFWEREPSGSCFPGDLDQRHPGSFGILTCRQSLGASARRVLRNVIAGGASKAKRPRVSFGSSQSSVNGPSCSADLDRCIGKLGALPRLRSFRQAGAVTSVIAVV